MPKCRTCVGHDNGLCTLYNDVIDDPYYTACDSYRGKGEDSCYDGVVSFLSFVIVVLCAVFTSHWWG